VSTRHSSRSTGGRLSSVIIHDIDEGHASEEEEEKESHSEEPENQPNPDIVPPATRTRKAKDTQKRLGVGRPAAAGGSGVRVSTGRSKRGKAPRAALPVQDTIMEGTLYRSVNFYVTEHASRARREWKRRGRGQ